MNKQVKAILKTMLDDAKSVDLKKRSEVLHLLDSDPLCLLMIAAGCHGSVLGEIKDGLELTYIQRQVYYRELWNRIKEAPAKAGA